MKSSAASNKLDQILENITHPHITIHRKIQDIYIKEVEDIKQKIMLDIFDIISPFINVKLFNGKFISTSPYNGYVLYFRDENKWVELISIPHQKNPIWQLVYNISNIEVEKHLLVDPKHLKISKNPNNSDLEISYVVSTNNCETWMDESTSKTYHTKLIKHDSNYYESYDKLHLLKIEENDRVKPINDYDLKK